MNFHCQINTFTEGCTSSFVPACGEEEEDCDIFEPTEECEEQEWTEGYCQPDEIECDNDAACPSDWRCKQIEEYSCVEATVSSTDAESNDGDEQAAPEPSFNEVSCEETVRSLCVPLGVYEGYFAGGSSPDRETAIVDGDPNTTTNPTEPGDGSNGSNGSSDSSGSNGEPNSEETANSTNADVEDDAGCDAKSTSPTPLALFGLLALLGLRRRLA
jgi:MYXO-CTERM domain-containing protein